MYVSKITLDEEDHITLNGGQATDIIESSYETNDVEFSPAVSLLGKARAGRHAALKNITVSELDMRLENILQSHNKKKKGFEAVDTIVKQLVMHDNISATA